MRRIKPDAPVRHTRVAPGGPEYKYLARVLLRFTNDKHETIRHMLVARLIK